MGDVLDIGAAQELRERLRSRAETLVFTNGHFDLLHIGHLEYLEKARALGDALFVGLNGDASTARLKGPGRPLVPADERARLLAALTPVTAVIVFEEDTAEFLLRALQPEIYVKGGDYADKSAAGARDGRELRRSGRVGGIPAPSTAQPVSSAGPAISSRRWRRVLLHEWRNTIREMQGRLCESPAFRRYSP